MIRTIQEIRQRRIDGKKKWGKDLLIFLTPYFESGRTYDEMVYILDKEYNIQIESASVRNLKSKYGKKNSLVPTETTLSFSQENLGIRGKEEIQKEFVQKQEKQNQNDWAEDAYKQIYGQEKRKEFDLDNL